MTTATQAERIVTNRALLERASVALGKTIKSFDDWKQAGRWVKRGEKQKSFRVKCGSRTIQDPLTGNDLSVPQYKMAYGFTEDQVS